ncbi:MAG: molybdenum cofactor guanylyltransferase [Pseudomonadota bacterium]|nr:molybdenum cofactor guanylyltransferase [Pseudomonadota bacterium]
MIALDEISSLILCGGKGERFGNKDKPLVPFDGDLGSLPMVDYAIDRLPITLELLISANRNIEQYLLRGKVIQDSDCNLLGQGPLIGIYAGLITCNAPWLLVCPGDMPVLPKEWNAPLLGEDRGEARSRVLHDGERLQSLLCLIPKSLAQDLGAFIRSGGYTVKDWHSAANAAIVPSKANAEAFVNINSEADMHGS